MDEMTHMNQIKPSFEVKSQKYDPIKSRFTPLTQTKIKMSTIKWRKLIITSTISKTETNGDLKLRK